jgi:hypothetical protein
METLKFTLIAFISFLIISITYGIYNASKPLAEYHIECIGNDKVKLMDENYNQIRVTTIDSIGYYIIEDNI